MASAVSGVTKKKQMIQCAQKMNTQLKNIITDMDKLSKALNACMKGDGTNPYWNGVDAQNFYKKAIGNVTNNLKDYKTAYERADVMAVASEIKN